MLKTLMKSIREYKKPTYQTLCFMFGEALMETGIFYFTARFVNQLQKGAELSTILKTGALLAIMAFISLTCGTFGGKLSAKASAGFAKNLRKDLFYAVQSFSFENIDKFSTSSLVTRMTTDITNVQMAYMMTIRTAIRSPLLTIFSIVMAIILGGKIAIAYAVTIPMIIIGFIAISRVAMPAFKKVFKKYDALNESIEENVSAMRVVKGFVREEYEKEKFNNEAEKICKNFTFAEKAINLYFPIMQLCSYINWIIILLLGSRITILSKGTKMGSGSISVMLAYGFQVLFALMMLSMIYVMITMSAESGRRIAEVLEEKTLLKSPDNPIQMVKDGSIDFENVSFSYSKNAKKSTLSDINFHVDSGMVVGILGDTGSSKTSLVQLIPRLYDVTKGTVKVGNVNVKEYDLKVLRDSVAMVLQKNEIFSGTIKDNLKWGNANATDEEIIEACKLAQADSFIQQFPEKYNTFIEQGGTNVSGGQKQRICIARALLKKPKILILDDSTSAVDTKTDNFIREGFKQFIPETTKIIISQRVSSVMDANLIILMEDGKISQMGTHSELMNRSDTYKETYIQQTKGGGLDE